MAAMNDAISSALLAHRSSPGYGALSLAFGFECVRRVRHLLEDEGVLRCLGVLETYLQGRVDARALEAAAAEAAALAGRHQGS